MNAEINEWVNNRMATSASGSVHQNHLRSVLNHRSGMSPPVSDSVSLGGT